MKYTYKNESDSSLVEINLNGFQLTVRTTAGERIIPYSAITDVRLERKKDIFTLTIDSLDFGSLRIGNRMYITPHQWEDQSRQYQTFVRVLHLHLLNASCKAEFCSGVKLSGLIYKIMLVALTSVAAYVVEDFMDLVPLAPVIAGALVLVVGIIVLALPYLKNPPKTYNPTDIPLNLLPPTS